MGCPMCWVYIYAQDIPKSSFLFSLDNTLYPFKLRYIWGLVPHEGQARNGPASPLRLIGR